MSRIYNNIIEAVKETERELVEMGTVVTVQSMQDIKEEMKTTELQGYTFKISSSGMSNLEDDFISLGGNLNYAEQEAWDRVDEKWLNPGNAYLSRGEVWKPFLHDGRFAYTYNERIREQLKRIIAELIMRPGTRQAVITMYDRHQDIANLGGNSRIPCSMYYQFLRRTERDKEYLDAIYTMRSCDIYTHFIYDIFLGMKLQEYIAGSLGISPRYFTFFAGSLHAYQKDIEKRRVF